MKETTDHHEDVRWIIYSVLYKLFQDNLTEDLHSGLQAG